MPRITERTNQKKLKKQKATKTEKVVSLGFKIVGFKSFQVSSGFNRK